VTGRSDLPCPLQEANRTPLARSPGGWNERLLPWPVEQTLQHRNQWGKIMRDCVPDDRHVNLSVLVNNSMPHAADGRPGNRRTQGLNGIRNVTRGLPDDRQVTDDSIDRFRVGSEVAEGEPRRVLCNLACRSQDVADSIVPAVRRHGQIRGRCAPEAYR
jgi:hypothetical protein